MRIALQLTDRIKYRWPADYCREFAHKASDRGHEVFMVADEPDVVVNMTKQGVYDRTKEKALDVLETCDVFVGPPLALADGAERRGLKVVALQGASLRGTGVRSSTFCAGCDSEGKLEPRLDCLWEDELCMSELTPNMVLEAICESSGTRKTVEPARN